MQGYQQLRTQRQQQALWRVRSNSETVDPSLNFASNDYLALSRNQAIVSAFQQGLQRWGTGSGGSPLTSGYQGPHEALEAQLCEWLNAEAALLFSSGFAANQSVINLARKQGYQPVLDRLCHASIYAGAGERPLRFRHNDLAHLSQQCAKAEQLNQTAAPLVVTEGVFSMDGDGAPIAEILALLENSNALVFVDDAHGIGCYGEQGCGSVTKEQAASIPVRTITFSKALGLHGAAVVGQKAWIESLVQLAPDYIYSTAMSAAQAFAIQKSVNLVRSESALQTQLQANIASFKQGAAQLKLKIMPSNTAIQPLWVGSNAHAITLSQLLQAQGIFCTAIRPPTVPPNEARLRFTLTNHQRDESYQRLFSSLKNIFDRYPELQEACCGV
ncbi:aminotransferase class I/II-fold pyridoxal phosphate-dependent enzyme [Aliidiomarina celeris]|uniref:aminotransferase class I/II-fold pyridoxal phosphate-dependent enzyme n=1 Tax=Aliidiomarina celeris TaxID=2249428 RepID=UPI000DEA8710|nr:8-amino-7-oxononanoate synthase [Aliidiomarina celeris]